MGGKQPRAGRPGSWKRKADLLDELESAGVAGEVALRAVKDAMQEAAAVLRLASGTRAASRSGGDEVSEVVAGGLTGIEHCARTALERLGVAYGALGGAETPGGYGEVVAEEVGGRQNDAGGRGREDD